MTKTKLLSNISELVSDYENSIDSKKINTTIKSQKTRLEKKVIVLESKNDELLGVIESLKSEISKRDGYLNYYDFIAVCNDEQIDYLSKLLNTDNKKLAVIERKYYYNLSLSKYSKVWNDLYSYLTTGDNSNDYIIQEALNILKSDSTGLIYLDEYNKRLAICNKS